MVDRLRFIPLGGVGEVGKNMSLLEYGGEAIAVDCGLMFPESDMLGVDVVIPDISYIMERPEMLSAIVLTHGHEDHIGALPYILKEISVPLYASELTRGLIEVKLRNAKLLDEVQIHTVEPGDTVEIGPFRVGFFHVSHSIPGAMGLAIETPLGMVIHTGEYKFDYTPVDGKLTDFGRLALYGEKGVLALLADSTNAERSGYTPSEQMVSEAFDKIFAAAKGRILVATFASNISRVQQVADVAMKYNRRLGVTGRSMVDNVRMAMRLGYFNSPNDIILRLEELEKLPPEQVTIVCTGTQGEPTSALVRMANQEHQQLSIMQGDTIVLSATPIPGNEELVHRTIDNLFRLGATVYYPPLSPVHVSGHAAREEQKMMMALTNPRYFIPIQGEYRHLVLHARIAEEVGIPPENIFIVENGQVVEFTEKHAYYDELVPCDDVLIDGLGVGDVGEVVLRDRRILSRDGFFVVVAIIDAETGELINEPEVISRGFVYMRDSEELIEEAKEKIAEILSNGSTESEVVSEKIQKKLGQFLYDRTHRRPMIFPVVVEV